MLKKSITYVNFDEEEVTEDFYFHLSKAEIVKLELSHKGGFEQTIEKIIKAEDGKAIIEEFERIILLTCGRRSDDGKRFIKNDRIREEFMYSEAYSVLFMELVTDATKAAEFIAGVIPKSLAEEAAQVASGSLEVVPNPDEPDFEPRILTRKDFGDMSLEEITELGPKLLSGEVVLSE